MSIVAIILRYWHAAADSMLHSFVPRQPVVCNRRVLFSTSLRLLRQQCMHVLCLTLLIVMCVKRLLFLVIELIV